MRSVVNRVIRRYLKLRLKKINDFAFNPAVYQQKILHHLLKKAAGTLIGKKHHFQRINTLEEYQKRVPVFEYNDLKNYIHRMMLGEESILWPGRVRYFSKSSGTSEDKSKYLPVSRDSLIGCHVKGSWDTMTAFYNNVPGSRLFEKKSILIGGSYELFAENKQTIIGDISSLLMMHMPPVGKPFAALDKKTFLWPDWEEKIDRIADLGIDIADDIVMMCGVPTWSITIFNKILEKSGRQNMSEVWPYFQGFIHGGVNFSPYKKTFQNYFPAGIAYQEIYNSTEGFFAMQDDFTKPEMLLLLDNGIFFEFIPCSELSSSSQARAFPLWEVEKGIEYAIVVSSTAGLWRLLIGDTVRFTSIKPYRIQITGRTKLFINAFGEEVVIENTDQAIALTCEECNAEVADYTVAPFYLDENQRGRHDWLIDFVKPPENLNHFAKCLDNHLRSLNSDYDAKRTSNLALNNLAIEVLPRNTFARWLANKGRLGGQSKVPRLSNNRKLFDEILHLSKKGVSN